MFSSVSGIFPSDWRPLSQLIPFLHCATPETNFARFSSSQVSTHDHHLSINLPSKYQIFSFSVSPAPHSTLAVFTPLNFCQPAACLFYLLRISTSPQPFLINSAPIDSTHCSSSSTLASPLLSLPKSQVWPWGCWPLAPWSWATFNFGRTDPQPSFSNESADRP